MESSIARSGAPLPFRSVAKRELEAGREALARLDYASARASFAAALERQESIEALDGLAESLLWLGRPSDAMEAWGRAFRRASGEAQTRAAARFAVHLAVTACDALGDELVARGWLHRARLLLEPLVEPVPELASLALWEGHFAYFEGDEETVRQRIAEAVALARRFGLADVELHALALDGLLRVVTGAVDDGLRLLDTATTAALSGQLGEPTSHGQVCCYQLRACEQLHAFDRASRWLTGIRAHCAPRGVPLPLSHCRTHHARILIWRGEWAEAEAEIRAATDELAEAAPAALPFLHALLGEVRRRQGRLDEADELLARAEGTADGAFGRAALALERGDPAAALDLAERGCRRLTAGNRIGRAPGLDLVVRARCARGEADAARAAAAELDEIAALVDNDALAATAAAARGRWAEAAGDAETARCRFEDAVDLYERSGSPYEAARARVDLARVLGSLDRRAAACAELSRAAGAFARLGAARDTAAAEAARRRLGGAPLPAGDGLTERQAEVLRLIATGLSNRQIAARLHLSEATVKRHVADILTRLGLPSRAAAAAHAVKHGLA